MNEDLTTFIEPELEARIVALVLGEASAFEQEELERVIAQRPELQLFKARLEKLHGLVGEAVKPPDEEEWKLSGSRREKVLAKIQEPSPVAEPAPGRRVSKFPRRLVYYGSAACFIAIVGGLATPAILQEKKERQAPMMLSYSTAEVEEESGRGGVASFYATMPQDKAPGANADAKAADLLADLDESYFETKLSENAESFEIRGRMDSELRRKSKSNAPIVASNSIPAPTQSPDDRFGYTGKKDGKSEFNRRDGGIVARMEEKNVSKKGREIEALAELSDEIALSTEAPAVTPVPAPATAVTAPPVAASPMPAKPTAPGAPVPNFGAQPKFDDRTAMGPQLESTEIDLGEVVLERKQEQIADKRFEDSFDVSGPEPAPEPASGKPESKSKPVGYENLGKNSNSLDFLGLDIEAASPEKAESPPAPSSKMAAVVPAEGGISNGRQGQGGQDRGRVSGREMTGATGGGAIVDHSDPANIDFIDGVELPEAEGQTVAGIVTAGMRSGNEAITRNSVDAILNSPGQGKGVTWGAKTQSGGERDTALGGDSPLEDAEVSLHAEKKPADQQSADWNKDFSSESLSEFEGRSREAGQKVAERNKKAKPGRSENGQGFPQSEPTPALKLAEKVKEDFVPADDPFGGGGEADQAAMGDDDGFGPADPFAAPGGDGGGAGGGLAEQEMLRRQNSVVEADALLMKGRKAYAEGDYETATAAYRQSLEKLPAGTATEERRKVVNDHLKDGSLALSQNYRRTGRYDEARQLLTEIEKNNPGDEAAKKGLEYLDDPIRTSPAGTYEHTKQVDQVRRGLYTGEGFYDLGQYDKAEEHFKEVLRTDPYNKAARRWLERTAAIKSDYYRAAYDNTRAKMVPEEEQKAASGSGPATDDGLGMAQQLLAQVESQLDEFVEMDRDGDSNGIVDAKDIDKVRRGLYTGEGYHDLGLFDKAEAEFKKVLEVDPYNPAAREWFTKNAEVRETTGGESADAARARMLAEVNQAWELAVPPAEEGKDSESTVREMRFALPLGFTDTLASSLESEEEDVDAFGDTSEDFGIDPNVGVEELLKYSGISFMEGANATLDRETNTLVVRNTSDNLQLVNQLVAMVSKQKEQDDRVKEAQLKKIEAFETPVATKSDSTFSLNVSDVSFKLAKASLANGQWPDATKVRQEEFVNALSYGDDSPTQSEKVACVIEQGSHPFMQQRNLMRVSMSTAALGRNASTPLRLTVLLDQSGSMERADRAESVRRAFALLSSQLNANDEITLVGFARTPRLLAERVKGNQSGRLAEIVSNPLTEGGTNLEAALSSGLQLARQQYVEGAQNRIILLTDGAANLGDALPENLAKQVEQMRDAGIAFDACGVGADGLNDDILTSLTKKGDGRYYFLDRPEDADDGFARQIAGALRPAAKNVKVQVIFNPERVSKFKLYGFEKHKLKKEDFRNDSVDAAEMAAEESGVALYHFEPMPEGEGDIGTVSVRFLDTSTNQMVERTWTIPYDPDSASFSDASPTLRLAGVAGLFAEKLKGSPVGERVELKRLRQEIQMLKPTFENQSRFQELQTMLQQAGQ